MTTGSGLGGPNQSVDRPPQYGVVKVPSLFADTSARVRALDEQIASAEDRYYWWFDHPVEWERPARTLYITGWCVSRYGKKICSDPCPTRASEIFG